jgi:hypothetical protein
VAPNSRPPSERGIVIAHPRDRHDVAAVAGEPAVDGVAGGAGLAGDVGAAQSAALARAGAVRVTSRSMLSVTKALRGSSTRASSRQRGARLVLEQHLAVAVDDLGDQIRLDGE